MNMIYSRRNVYSHKNKLPIALISLLFLVAGIWYGISQLYPPRALGLDVDANVFSAERSLLHVHQLGKEERIPGSDFHSEARSYIQDTLSGLGIDNHVQEATSVDPNRRVVPFGVGKVQNIVARIPGEDSTGAIILVAHYDSVPSGPGVGDDVMAVGAILEAARALTAGPKIRNDVILLFTDAHEYQLLGVRAFLEQHPWAEEVALMFNFEGQGPNGPVFMFETSADNRWLIEEYAKAVDYPLGSSLSMDVYQNLNFDNDFRVFMDFGYQGLGFAILSDMAYYHSALDSLERLDISTLQHHGSHILGLARHFGALDLQEERAGESSVYFNISRSILVHYPQSWARFFAILAVLIFVVAIGIGAFSGQLSWGGLILGLLSFGVTAAVTGGLIMGISRLFELTSRTYQGPLYYGAFMALGLAVSASLLKALRKLTDWTALATGGLGLWAVFTIGSVFVLPGGSYMFTWPLLFGSLALIAVFLKGELIPNDGSDLVIRLLGCLPGVVIITPIIWLLFLVLTPSTPYVATGLFLALVYLLIPVLSIILDRSSVVVPLLALGVCAGLLAITASTGVSPAFPLSNEVFYAFDTEANQAVWASSDLEGDEWTAQFFSGNPRFSNLPGVFPFGFTRFVVDPAPVLDTAGPGFVVHEHSVDQTGVRTVRLTIMSGRGAPTMQLFVEPGTTIIRSEIDGLLVTEYFDPEWYWGVRYMNVPDDGFEVMFQTVADKPLKLTAVDQSYDLLTQGIMDVSVRSAEMIKKPNSYLTDSILVSSVYVFDHDEQEKEVITHEE